MTQTKPFRIPGQLKRKLQASLQSLTPQEAGRLYLIYCHEAERKNIPPSAYPPVIDLDDAWDRRLESAKAKASQDPQAFTRKAKEYNGWVFFRQLVGSASIGIATTAAELLADLYPTVGALSLFLVGDLFSGILRQVEEDLHMSIPWPVSPEEYDRIMTRIREKGLRRVNDTANFLVDDWAAFHFGEHDAFRDLDAYRKSIAAGPDDHVGPSDEAIRRQWVKVEGEAKVLTQYFDGDRDNLDLWIREGGQYKGLTEEAYNEAGNRIYDRLEAWLEAGELEGGTLFAGTDDVLLVEGEDGRLKLPAWAALRYVWDDWLYRNQCRRPELPTPAPGTIRGIRSVYRLEDGSTVEGQALVALVVALVEDCRSRPWGEGLPKDVDFGRLTAFMLAENNPLTPTEAPDLGLVDLEAFRPEGEKKGITFEDPWLAATVASMKTKAGVIAEEFGLPVEKVDDFFAHFLDYEKGLYYPAPFPDDRRRSMASTVEFVSSAQFSRRFFSILHSDKSTSVVDFLGPTFGSPLADSVRRLAERIRDVEEFKTAVDRLSKDYFGGLSLYTPFLRRRLDILEEVIADAESKLANWVKEFEGWKSLDVTALRLKKLPLREDSIREFYDAIIDGTLKLTHLKPDEYDLGPKPTFWGKA